MKNPISYILKGIPPDLWREAKKKAIDEEKSMKEVLIGLLQNWVRKEVDHE